MVLPGLVGKPGVGQPGIVRFDDLAVGADNLFEDLLTVKWIVHPDIHETGGYIRRQGTCCIAGSGQNCRSRLIEDHGILICRISESIRS